MGFFRFFSAGLFFSFFSTRPFRFSAFALVFISFNFLACSSMNVKQSSGALSTKGRGGLLNVQSASIQKSDAISKSKTEFTEILGKKLLVTDFDFPIVKNSRVEFWVKHFTGNGRKSFARYMKRLERLSPLILPVLQEYGLPNDLLYVAMVESGFSTRAVSSAGAVGVWQFIRSTGKLYGLDRNWWVDERRDPVKASRAAAEYFSDLYEKFENWELVAAAYNAGEGRVMRGIQRHGTRDYWKLARRRAFRRETVNYVPKIMAAAIIAKNPSVFGFKKPIPNPAYWLDTSKVLVKNPTGLRTLAKFAGVSVSELRKLNPELRRWSTPPRNYRLRVPSLQAAKGVKKVVARSPGKYKNFLRYRVKKNDTLYDLSHRYRVPVRLIASLNNVSRSRTIYAGTVLTIPVAASRKATKVVKSSRKVSGVSKASAPHVLHVIKKNDTLYDLSRRYKTTVSDIKRWNLIVHHRRIRPGQLLRIYPQ